MFSAQNIHWEYVGQYISTNIHAHYSTKRKKVICVISLVKGSQTIREWKNITEGVLLINILASGVSLIFVLKKRVYMSFSQKFNIGPCWR